MRVLEIQNIHTGEKYHVRKIGVNNSIIELYRLNDTRLTLTKLIAKDTLKTDYKIISSIKIK